MKTTTMFAAAAMLLAAVPAFSQNVNPGIEVVKNDKLALAITGRAQMIGVLEHLPDPHRDHNRLYLFQKQARIGFKGDVEDMFRFDTQFAFGGESANGSNTDLSLLDFYADIPLKHVGLEGSVFKIGQFRVPFGRENLTDTGFMGYTSKSIQHLGSNQGRDYGLAFMHTKDVWTGTFGTFSGGGRDVPQRFLPEVLGIPYLVTRFGYNDGYDDDLYHVKGLELAPKRDGKAFMIGGIFMNDTAIGHSSALQTRQIEKNLLVDSGFNPYIAAGPNNTAGNTTTMQRGHLWWIGADAAARKMLGSDSSVAGELEGNWGSYANRYGVLHMTTGRAQVDYTKGRFNIGLRGSVLKFDRNSGFLSTKSAATATAAAKDGPLVKNELGTEIYEITPAMSWHFKGHRMKIVADLPIFLNAPLWYEDMGRAVTPGAATPVGAYSFVSPSATTQNSLLGTVGNHTERKTTVQARMMFQFMF